MQGGHKAFGGITYPEPAMALAFFDPQPDASELPARFPSPFAHGPPHPLARRAAEALQVRLRGLAVDFDAPDGGKMFGVLVVAAPDGRIGYVSAFSGMLGGMRGATWHVDGFVGPVFDAAARDAVWPAGEAELRDLDARLRELTDGARAAEARAELAAFDATHLRALDELRARHRENRERAARRRADGDGAPELDQESRADAAERRRLLAAHAKVRAPLAARVAALDSERATLAQRRRERSRVYLEQIRETYAIANARGEARTLRELFEPIEPPGGAGDCAAPKLLAHAYRHGLRPLALAELWWGAPPATGGRRAGTYYPACRGKCGPILAHALAGLDAEDPPVFGGERHGPEEPRTVYEDAWLVIVDKPCGMLSVPGRSGALRDSLATRMRARLPDATGPLVVHRLDLDTSGLVLVAKDATTHAALQRLFARREIAKRYVAWLDGVVAGERGTIDLALRVDLDDRPRQLHDPVHGKPALTDWRVLARAGARTRVAFVPRTGRTHQLRVHAAVGLGAPIAGDRLYGDGGDDAPRLLLHAEHLAFTHPHTGERIEVTCPTPF